MADDIDIFAGSVGQQYIIAADEVAGKKYQRVKIAVGADGTVNDLVGDNAASDGVASSHVGAIANSRGYLYNGATWDRARVAPTNQNGIGVVQAAALMVRDTDGLFRAVEAGNADNQNKAYIPSSGGYVFNGTSWDRIRSGNADDIATGIPANAQYIFNAGTGTWKRAPTGMNDGTSFGAVPQGAPMLYNGTSLDRQRGNEVKLLMALAARTAGANAGIQTNHNARGVIIEILVTVAGTGTLNPSLRSQGTGDFQHLSLPNTASSTLYVIYPGVTQAGNFFSNVIGRAWGFQVDKSDSSSWTYTVSAQQIV